MIGNIKKIILCSLLSLSMASTCISPVFAQEEIDSEEIGEDKDMEQIEMEEAQPEDVEEETTEDVLEEGSDLEDISEDENIEQENEIKHYNGFSYTVTPLNAIQIIGYSGPETTLVIPDTIEGKPVRYIAFQAFTREESIQELRLGDNIEEIGDQAFWGCSNLRTVLHWGNKLRKIGREAFYGCNLTEIEIPETITSLGDGAYSYNTDLKVLKYYADKLDSIENEMGCFNKCGFKDEHGFEMIVGDNVQKLPDYLFRASTVASNNFEYARITKISGAKNLKEIGKYTFAQCNKFQYLTLPESVTTIRSNAFFNCYYLNKIYFSSNIQTIEDNAFSECPSLWYMEFAQNPPTFGENALDRLYVQVYYQETDSISWEETKKSNYGATQVDWIGQLESKLTYNESMDPKMYTSPNWPNEYPSNCTYNNTSRHYSFPAAASIGIDFDENSVTESTHDYVQIVTSQKTYKYSGSAFPKHLVIPDNSVDIGFVSDGSVEKSGFQAKVYPIFNNDITVTSPNWPNNYPNGVHIEKELNYEGAKQIYIEFDPSSCTEANGTAFYDYVEFFDINGKSKGKYGGNMNYSFHIMGSYVKIVFHSDGSINDKGFSLRARPYYDVPEQASQLAGYTLSLSGDIGVNFMMNLSSQAISAPDTYMEFSLPGKTLKRVNLDQARIVQMGKNQYYAFPYHVSAKEMTETITAKLYHNGVCQNTYQYTVEDYANYIINHYSIFDSKIIDIARAMLMYGKNAQVYFDYHTERLPKYNQTLYSPSLDAYKYYENSTGSIRFAGARLILKQKPGIKLYFTGATSSTKFYVDKVEVEKVKEGDKYYIVISNIDKMSKMFDIDSNNYYLRYGIFSYGYCALVLDSSHQDLKNLISAMNLYDMAFWAKG